MYCKIKQLCIKLVITYNVYIFSRPSSLVSRDSKPRCAGQLHSLE